VFLVNAYNGRKPYKERDLYPLLLSVMNQSRSVAPPVGMLTTDDRDSWTAACERLLADDTNGKSLEALQRSILLLCLDEPAGETGTVGRALPATHARRRGERASAPETAGTTRLYR
ncbi:hypothetical protein MTO96_035361, partial [Rhipicephalus appendiculatus]